MKYLLLLFAIFSPSIARAQEPVFFQSSDSIRVKAELYLQNNRYPFIIILQGRENAGEYAKIAPRLLHLDYNCLSVMIRQGLNAKNDIQAAIAYSRQFSERQVVLLGSTRCASLCLLCAANNPDVRAVIALSPGEYLQPEVKIKNIVKELHQQVFVGSTTSEFPYVQQMFANAANGNITLFTPDQKTSFRGSALLDDSNPSSNEYWFALMMFFKKLEDDRGE